MIALEIKNHKKIKKVKEYSIYFNILYYYFIIESVI